MVVKKMSFPTVWEDNPGIENQNIDVFVELEDGYTYGLVLGTRKNIEYLMDKDKKNYFRPGTPFIMVKELTKEIIEETVKAYAEEEDEYWLKSYHFAGEIDKTVFDKLQVEHIEYIKEFYELSGLDDVQVKHMKKLRDEELDKLDKLDDLQVKHMKKLRDEELDKLDELNNS